MREKKPRKLKKLLDKWARHGCVLRRVHPGRAERRRWRRFIRSL